MQIAIPCSLMRGGTSKGLYFKAEDLPKDVATRNRVLLSVMGSPDPRQIDGVGGAHPLTSKVAIVSPSKLNDVDVDYLFLQVAVDKSEVSDSQNCGNLLAGVGPFAIDQGMVRPLNGSSVVRIRMLNTDGLAVATVNTPDGKVDYAGEARIDGVPETAAPVMLEFLDIAGASCGALMPTGNRLDRIQGIDVTCIDNGMPVVILRAADFGLSGYEGPEQLEANLQLKEHIESIRLEAGQMMNLDDVVGKTVPKMCLVSPAREGGVINTRTFIPHRVHQSIGVLGAVSVASACLFEGTIAQEVSQVSILPGAARLDVEHPTGSFSVEIDADVVGKQPEVKKAALLRTARLLMHGSAMIPDTVWDGHQQEAE